MSTADVDAWMSAYDNPMKPVVAAMRATIMNSDARISEGIKWQSPTFMYKGNIASFNPRAKKHASLMFHGGASIQGDFPTLEGSAKSARAFKAASLEELAAKKDELQRIIVAWCDQKDSL